LALHASQPLAETWSCGTPTLSGASHMQSSGASSVAKGGNARNANANRQRTGPEVQQMIEQRCQQLNPALQHIPTTPDPCTSLGRATPRSKHHGSREKNLVAGRSDVRELGTRGQGTRGQGTRGQGTRAILAEKRRAIFGDFPSSAKRANAQPRVGGVTLVWRVAEDVLIVLLLFH
jgi:hypothetical protein